MDGWVGGWDRRALQLDKDVFWVAAKSTDRWGVGASS